MPITFITEHYLVPQLLTIVTLKFSFKVLQFEELYPTGSKHFPKIYHVFDIVQITFKTDQYYCQVICQNLII